MKTFKLKYLTIVLAAGFFASDASAAALNFDSNGKALFGNSFFSSGSFSDTYTFSLTTSGTFSSSVSSGYFTSLSGGQVWGVDITGFSLTGPVSVNGVETVANIPFTTFNADSWKISSLALTSGNYSLKVSGVALPVSNILIAPTGYGGEATLALSPVPEPESYSMMLAGIGLMGFVAARRKA